MRTSVPEKLIKIIDEIDASGSANPTRLTVLKKWFEHPGRLPAFGLWVAARAASRKGETAENAVELVNEARTLLAGRKIGTPGPDLAAAEHLYYRLRGFQNEYQHQRWGPVRIVRHWNLLLVEEGLDIYLRHYDSPYHGYKLAVDYCRHYDPRCVNDLNGPSRRKLERLVRFMSTLESIEVP